MTLRARGRPALALLDAALLLVAGVGGARLVQRHDDATAPAASAFVAIERMPRQPPPPTAGPDASTGSFVSACGRNENAHHNADNMIMSPRQVHAAHHVHEYVGNVSTDAFSTDRSLVAAATTCGNRDLSTYYWPVLRVLTGHRRTATGDAAGWDGGHHNRGIRVAPAAVLVQFDGNPASKVVGMPRFLRLSTGNARAATMGAARWGCTGSSGPRTPLYPLCPDRQKVLRIYEFPSCWDGRRLDSPDHRTHAVFPAPNGACPRDTFPVPRLRLEVAYRVPPGRSFAVDTLPEQRRDPTTDHAHFVNVMPDALMTQVVTCLNSGRRC